MICSTLTESERTLKSGIKLSAFSRQLLSSDSSTEGLTPRSLRADGRKRDRQPEPGLTGPQRGERIQNDGTARYLVDRGIGDRQRGKSAARHLARVTDYTLADAEKLPTASFSESNVSNTVNSFVIDNRSVMRFVRLSSLRLPPWRLTVVYVRTISPSPALSM